MDFEITALACHIMDLICPFPFPTHLATFQFEGSWSESEQELNALWLMIYGCSQELYKSGIRDLSTVSRKSIDDELVDLLEKRSAVDRIVEVSELVERAKDKLEGKPSPTRVVVSPLAVFKWLVKVNDFRPPWTRSDSLYGSNVGYKGTENYVGRPWEGSQRPPK